MRRVLPILYTLATVLIIVGALFIFQGENYGLAILTGGLGLNIIYRLLTLDYKNVQAFKLMDVLRVVGILVMLAACLVFFTNSDQKFNLLILAIVLDLLLNLKEISFKTK